MCESLKSGFDGIKDVIISAISTRSSWTELTVDGQMQLWNIPPVNIHQHGDSLGVTEPSRQGGQSGGFSAVCLSSVSKVPDAGLSLHWLASRDCRLVPVQGRNALMIQVWSRSRRPTAFWLKVSAEDGLSCKVFGIWPALLGELEPVQTLLVLGASGHWVQSPCPVVGQKVSLELRPKNVTVVSHSRVTPRCSGLKLIF